MKPIRATVTIREHAGRFVATVSDGSEVSVHRETRSPPEGNVTIPSKSETTPENS